MDVDEIYRVAGRLKTEVVGVRVTVDGPSGPTTIDGLSASIGAALPCGCNHFEELLRAANRALQAAKRNASTDSFELSPPRNEATILVEF